MTNGKKGILNINPETAEQVNERRAVLYDTHSGTVLENLQPWMTEMIEEYRRLMLNPLFRNQPLQIRTFDLPPNDSKNREYYRELLELQKIKRDPDAPITGFDYYRNTQLGEFHLILQVAAILMAHYQAFPDGGKDSPQIAIFFPMVRSAADLDFIQNEIMPAAKKLAAVNIAQYDAADPGSSKRNLDETEKSIEAVTERTGFGAMIEIIEVLDNPETRRAIIRHPLAQFFSFGTNDLEIQAVNLELSGTHLEAGEEAGAIDRDSPDAEHFLGKMRPVLMRPLTAFEDDVLTLAPEKPMFFCGTKTKDPDMEMHVVGLHKKGAKVALTVSAPDVKKVHNQLAAISHLAPAQFEAAAELVRNEETTDGLTQGMAAIANPQVERYEKVLKIIEGWQQKYQQAGYYDSLNHLDLDVVEGAGSAEYFEMLLELAVALGWFTPEQVLAEFSTNPTNLILLLVERLVAEGFIYHSEDGEGSEKKGLLDSWIFLNGIRSQFLKKRDAGDSRYKGNLHPDLLPDFLASNDLGSMTKEQFYRLYLTRSRYVFETVMRSVVTELMERMYPPTVSTATLPVIDPAKYEGLHLVNRRGVLFSPRPGISRHTGEAIVNDANLPDEPESFF